MRNKDKKKDNLILTEENMMTEQQYQIALKKFLDNGGKIEKLPYYAPDYSGRMLTKNQINFAFKD